MTVPDGYPTFDDDPAAWGLRLPPPMSEVEAAEADLLENWGPAGPPDSWQAWVSEVETYRDGPEPGPG
jgi:hypothetical protein